MESESSIDLMKVMKQGEADFGLSLLAATLAHEIRNPLQAIRLQLDLAYRTGASQSSLERISESINRLESVVEKVQRLSHRYEIHPTRIHLKDLVDSTLSAVQFWLTVSGITVRVQTHWEGEPVCKGDQELLQQVLLNLVMNSIQAMPHGGLLTVRISETVDAAQIEVQDTGVGVPANVLRLIGTPFFTTKSDGNGLGLAFCKTIASLHKGSIEFESAEGQGTKVTLQIAKTIGTDSEELGHA
jgi:two-component system sensor histidine kinase HydH